VLASLAGANAKSYDAVLYNRVKAGATLLQAGYYMVKVKGDNAVFTAVSDGKNYTTPVKVDNDGSKHDSTVANVDALDGIVVLRSIQIGRSSITLEFNK